MGLRMRNQFVSLKESIGWQSASVHREGGRFLQGHWASAVNRASGAGLIGQMTEGRVALGWTNEGEVARGKCAKNLGIATHLPGSPLFPYFPALSLLLACLEPHSKINVPLALHG